MLKIGPNKYECTNPENIKITFDPSQENNVQIRQKWDSDPAKDVDIKSGIVEPFTGSERKLVLSFAFTLPGSCSFDIGGKNGVVDTKDAVDTGDVEVKRLTFVP